MLGPAAVLHHIGSTAVPGLAAKPVIDLLLEVPDVSGLDAMADRFMALGYLPRGENGIPGRRYFVKGEPQRTHQLHAFRSGSADVVRHLAFRDHLRRHPNARDAYANLKREAALACNHDIHRYVAFMQSMQAQALAEWADGG